MTTGRINQVAARALRHCSWARLTRAAHSFITNRLPLAGGIRPTQSSGTPPTTNFRSSLRTLNVPTGVCTPWGNFPSGTRANDTANFGGFSLPVTLMIDSLFLPRLDARTCPALGQTGTRGLLACPCEDFCLCVCYTWGGTEKSTFALLCRLDFLLPLIYVTANRTYAGVQYKEKHKLFVHKQ